MRQAHFEAFAPVCPACRVGRGREVPLQVGRREVQDGEHLVQGALRCPAPTCALEFPVVDGIPILVQDVASVVRHSAFALLLREDLAPSLQTLLGDCLGPGSEYDTLRQHVSHYASDHWDDRAPDAAPSSGIADLVDAGWALGGAKAARTLDLGAATGRGTFELARRTDGLVLGLDLHVGMLRVAARVLREGRVRYARRRTGLVYDAVDFEVALPGAERVDFWLADACSLPLAAGVADVAFSMNLLDCVHAPLGHLQELARVLASSHGRGVLASPYDWSSGATPFASWIGGHSQRGSDGGDPASRLRTALAHQVTGLEIRREVERVPWSVRLHERSRVVYDVHMVAVERAQEPPPA